MIDWSDPWGVSLAVIFPSPLKRYSSFVPCASRSQAPLSFLVSNFASAGAGPARMSTKQTASSRRIMGIVSWWKCDLTAPGLYEVPEALGYGGEQGFGVRCQRFPTGPPHGGEVAAEHVPIFECVDVVPRREQGQAQRPGCRDRLGQHAR